MVESKARETIVAVSAAAILIASHFYVGYGSDFIPCTLDCGETYEAYIGALNLHRFGITHAGGLQDFAASPELASHPTVYTHNPNLGMYFRYALFRLGVHDVHPQAIWTSVPYAAGLLYMYLFLRAVSKSGILAALCLLNAATLYLLVTLWGFHGLRAFSWLLTFAPAYHLYRFSLGHPRARWQLSAAMVYAGLSIGIDYPFAVFNFFNLLSLAVLGIVPIRLKSMLGILGVSFGVPFGLRQIQIAWVMGPEFWAADFLNSMFRRVTLLGFFMRIPDDATLGWLYSARNVLKWPSPTGFQPLQGLKIMVDVYLDVLGTPLFIISGIWAAGMIILLVRGRQQSCTEQREDGPIAIGQVIVGCMGAQAVTFVLFGGYFSTFFGSALMPLLVHWIVPMFGATTYVLLANASRIVRVGRLGIPAAGILLGLFVWWRVETEVSAHLQLPPRGYPGREVLREMKGHSFVTIWISSAVSAYTHQWAARLHGPRWRVIQPGDLPFDREKDFYFFFEADRNNPRYRMPEFLFVPAINVEWIVDRRCSPYGGKVGLPVDGCTDLEGVAQRLAWLPRFKRGEDYLIYDLRKVYGGSGSTIHGVGNRGSRSNDEK